MEDIDLRSEEDRSQSEESDTETEYKGQTHEMWEITVLISVKLKRSPKFKDIDICLGEGTIKIVDLIGKWVDKSKIATIIEFNRNAIQEDFANTIDD